MADVGGVYLNFALWAVSLVPAWLVVGKIGAVEEMKWMENPSSALFEAQKEAEKKE